MNCKKQSYASHKIAVKVLNKIKADENYYTRKRQEIRTYKCPNCGMFHLTSTKKRLYKPIEVKITAVVEYWQQKLRLKKN